MGCLKTKAEGEDKLISLRLRVKKVRTAFNRRRMKSLKETIQ